MHMHTQEWRGIKNIPLCVYIYVCVYSHADMHRNVTTLLNEVTSTLLTLHINIKKSYFCMFLSSSYSY